MIKGRTILKEQIENLAKELKWVLQTLTNYPMIPEGKDWALASLEKEIANQLQKVDSLAQELASGGDNLDCWGHLRTYRESAAQVFRESFAYLHGALARANGLDNEICKITDTMLYDISRRVGVPWERFTILSEVEFYADLADIIRIRFPCLNVWNLPIAVHEFGHFVGRKTEVIHAGLGKFRFPLQEILAREQRSGDEKEIRHLHEHFADVFAVYTIGPAYACACVLTRFDPISAWNESTNHPAAVKRVQIILQALTKSRSQNSFDPYEGIIEELQKSWEDGLVITGRQPQFSKELSDSLGRRAQLLIDLLKQNYSSARYSSWPRAVELSKALEARQIPDVKPDDSIIDIVNAGWLSRLGAPAVDLEFLASTAKTCCLEIASRSTK
jgi:hypothetical protein